MVPGSPGGDDVVGTDPLGQLPSRGGPEHGSDSSSEGDAFEGRDLAEAAEGHGMSGGTVAPEGETAAGSQTAYGQTNDGEPGWGPPEIGWPGDPQNPYLQEGHGPVQYSQPLWPGPEYAPRQWPDQWSYREPPSPKVPRRPPQTTPGWFGVALVAALVGALVGGSLVAVFTSRAPQTIVREYFPTKGGKVQVGDVQSILASVLPAVVSIDTSSFRGVGDLGSYVQGAGTGMIIQTSGVILTNDHVIAGAQTVTVTLYGQVKRFSAKVIGADASRDIALVQVQGAGDSLPTVRLGNSNGARQGDGVLAIGNALALAGGPTVTEGIVSALNRSLTASTENGTTENLTGLIQTDAPINPGNSGGPLVNSSGQVVGMNTAVATSSQGNAPAQNVGFAIAVDEIRAIVAQILRHAGLP
ncbi:MAG: trypsin-like peptidase domain-containing protein [Acidimicrobiales bacterium]